MASLSINSFDRSSLLEISENFIHLFNRDLSHLNYTQPWHSILSDEAKMALQNEMLTPREDFHDGVLGNGTLTQLMIAAPIDRPVQIAGSNFFSLKGRLWAHLEYPGLVFKILSAQDAAHQCCLAKKVHDYIQNFSHFLIRIPSIDIVYYQELGREWALYIQEEIALTLNRDDYEEMWIYLYSCIESGTAPYYFRLNLYNLLSQFANLIENFGFENIGLSQSPEISLTEGYGAVIDFSQCNPRRVITGLQNLTAYFAGSPSHYTLLSRHYENYLLSGLVSYDKNNSHYDWNQICRERNIHINHYKKAFYYYLSGPDRLNIQLTASEKLFRSTLLSCLDWMTRDQKPPVLKNLVLFRPSEHRYNDATAVELLMRLEAISMIASWYFRPSTNTYYVWL